MKPFAMMFTVACVLSASACSLQGDAAYSISQRARENEEAVRRMREAMRQIPRGHDLADDALRLAFENVTLVARFDTLPSGKQQAYATYDYYRGDGTLVAVDTVARLSPDPDDRWRVDGPRLCKLDHGLSRDWACYRVARAYGGSLQFYIDEAGSPFDTLLTMVSSERMDGPPPGIAPGGADAAAAIDGYHLPEPR